MDSFDKLLKTVARLRAEDGCPWDREQTHVSLKAACIEEAAEVICGINVLTQTGDSENLKEELGDLLFQVVLHAQIAEEEGLFTIKEVCEGINDKMIRRHPHVFGKVEVDGTEQVLKNWEDIKAKERKADLSDYIPRAFEEAKSRIDIAKNRKCPDGHI